MEAAEQQIRYFSDRLDENTVLIQVNSEILLRDGNNLFDYEISNLSEQIREATGQLTILREKIVEYAIVPLVVITANQLILSGDAEPAFGAWIKEVLATVDAPTERTGKLEPDRVGTLGAATRVTRMSAAAGKRVLAGSSTDTFRVQVVDQNDFLIVIRGVDNKPLAGVDVTVKDLNGTAVKTVRIEDEKSGAAVFSANDFVCDYDMEMELSLTVDGSAVGYRSFYIPWLTMKRGASRTETLTPLSQEASVKTLNSSGQEVPRLTDTSSSWPPYVYSCTFNNMDIWRSDKIVRTSELNDMEFDFAIEVENPAKQSYTAPVLHYWTYAGKSIGFDSPEEKTMAPTYVETVTDTRTKYIYRDKWKQILSPDIKKEQRPFFEFPDTGKKLQTMLMPVRSKVDQPNIAGTESGSALQKVFGDKLGLEFDIPKPIGGKISIGIPVAEYLPTLRTDPFGYVTLTFGSPLTDPKKTEWKSEEQEKYDKAMKAFEKETFISRQKQKLGTAYKYYKDMDKRGKTMSKLKFTFGWFIMFAGKWERNDPDDKTTYWNMSGTAGLTVVLSYDQTIPVMLGPVPTYVNINFTASAGFGAGISAKVLTGTKDAICRDIDFDFSGLAISIRLALTVSFGLGLKGVVSVWIGAGGSLSIVLQFVRRQPVHIAAYLQAYLQVGAEIFFISYSKTVVQTPKELIYSNFNVDARRPFYLLMAWAEADEVTQEPDTVELEPQSYAALAPEATAVLTNEKEAMADIRVAEVSGHSFVFYITGGKLSWLDLNTGSKGVLSDLIDDRYGFIRNRKDYDFDVAADGNRLAIIACCADAFDADGYPKPSGSGNDNRHAYLYAVIARYEESLDSLVLVPLREDYNRMLDYKTLNQMYTGKYNIGYHPQIGVIRLNDSTKLVSGSLQGRHDATGEQGILSFQLMGSTLAIFSDAAVQSAIGEQNERTQMSNMITVEDVSSSRPYRGVHSSAFIALSTPKDGTEDNGAIELYDYAMNVAPVQTMLDRSDPDNAVLKVTGTERKAVALTTGDIGHMEVIQSVQNGSTAPARTIFYTQEESVGDRKASRLKSIYLAPKKTNSAESFSYDMIYTDYDLSLTDNDFRAVTLGASQYLYWLSTAPRENESDPNIWRISAVYYDSATGSVSDLLVLAEFTLPDIDGHTAVPGEIMLTASGAGNITAKPDLGTESGSSLAPMTLYSFPVTLQPVATLKGASVMDTTVSQGDFVTMDLSMMNEGNMGIGSFEADVILMENGVQKEIVETIYANCLNPADSRLVMRKTGETVATGESAIYRYKDFVYTPRQKEWIVKARNKTLTRHPCGHHRRHGRGKAHYHGCAGSRGAGRLQRQSEDPEGLARNL